MSCFAITVVIQILFRTIRYLHVDNHIPQCLSINYAKEPIACCQAKVQCFDSMDDAE